MPPKAEEKRKRIKIETASRYFLYACLLNLVVAVIVTSLVIIPPLAIPIKLAAWPGTWMMVAYFTFLIVGVLGNLAWSLIYSSSQRLLKINTLNRNLLFLHLFLFQVGVYEVTT